MGLLKKERAPDELPELALSESSNSDSKPEAEEKRAPEPTTQKQPEEDKVAPENKNDNGPDFENMEMPAKEESSEEKHSPEPVLIETPREERGAEDAKDESAEADIGSKINLEDIKSKLAEHSQDESNTPKFFDKILDDINSGIKDLGKLEDWYNNKFSSQDIVSNMKGYWEGNKADIIIQSFGADYKKKISENIKNLQALEEDWRGIYFQLIKKEEEMKAVEQDLKGTLAEFVDLCKRRNNEKEPKKEVVNTEQEREA